MAPCLVFSLAVLIPRRTALLQAALIHTAAQAATPTQSILVDSNNKLKNLTPKQIADVVETDLKQNQFLVTGKLTRSIYAETCTFKDEIDTYSLDKWITGTSALFDARKSYVELIGDVFADESQVRFRFQEVLCFNLPVLKPKVPLTGTLVLTRGADGLVEKYLEIWDTGVLQTISRAYL